MERTAVVSTLLVALASVAHAEPAELRALTAGGWRVSAAQRALPALEFRSAEHLETQNFVQLVYRGGALRLIAAPGGERVVGILVDVRDPHQAAFADFATATTYGVYRDEPYVVVLRIAPVEQATFETLKSHRWIDHELKSRLGTPTSEDHWHGIGFFEWKYVPEGLDFIGDCRPCPGSIEFELLKPFDPEDFDFGLPPVEYLADIDYDAMQAEVRKHFAQSLLGQRKEIDDAIRHGKSSPDGRFVLARINLGGTYNTEEIVIRERGKAERRYHPGYFIHDDDLAWLNDDTILCHVAQPTEDIEFHTFDAVTGRRRLVRRVRGGEGSHRVTSFGVGAPDRFWYDTDDGARHEVVVAQQAPAHPPAPPDPAP